MPIAGLLVYPGASAGRDNRTLIALEHGLAPLPVRRSEFANRAAGRGGPEKPELAVAHVVSEAHAFAAELGVPLGQLAVGGRSFGGRMASVAVAQGLAVGALVLLSYPLHPPGRPEQLRIAHLPQVAVPTLAVSGAADPFGTPEELRTRLGEAPGPVTFAVVPGNHSPADGRVVELVRDWLASLE
ncbi:dienelactone hydrolase [Miniimonas arenae]|uniref:Dienelactone hydrolase n=1 Tax=Miniimonas arenae TaxID=676201 RepID=A0A5C5B8Z8_9MICO|nr:alpha/beta family hydrolase [Miniimonas arenae]TNU73368.1 dienelactone hydrolase [Miniimonas arenae]